MKGKTSFLPAFYHWQVSDEPFSFDISCIVFPVVVCVITKNKDRLKSFRIIS